MDWSKALELNEALGERRGKRHGCQSETSPKLSVIDQFRALIRMA